MLPGNGLLALAAGGLTGTEQHRHVAPLLLGIGLDATDVLHRLRHPVEDPTSQLGVLHLPATEHDRHLHLAAVTQELLDLPGLGVEVSGTDLGPVLHLLDQDVCGLLAGFLGPLGLLVLVLPVVHDPTDRWIGLVGHLHEVEVEVMGHCDRLREGTDADLVTFGSDEPHLACAYAVVDPGLLVGWRCYCSSLLCVTQVPFLVGYGNASPAPDVEHVDAENRRRRVSESRHPPVAPGPTNAPDTGDDLRFRGCLSATDCIGGEEPGSPWVAGWGEPRFPLCCGLLEYQGRLRHGTGGAPPPPTHDWTQPMSTLWTPDGEHPVGSEAAPSDDPSRDPLSPEEAERAEALAREMAAVQEQLADTPADVIVSTHLMGLFELGAIHLSQQPPNLPQAALAIDAMGAVVDRLQGRLGENEETLRGALNQIRLAYVSVQQAEDAPEGEVAPEEDTDPADA